MRRQLMTFVRVWFTRFIDETLAVLICVMWTWLMSLNWLSRLILALAALAVPVTSLNAARPCCAETPTGVSLAGQLLIASPTIQDPHFDHVVLLVVPNEKGAPLGIVLNMPNKEKT